MNRGLLADFPALLKWADQQPEMREFYAPSRDEWVREAARIIQGAKDESGHDTGIPKFDSVMRFRPAETTMWIGSNGHGKTQALAQFTARWALQKHHCVMLSLEMKPARQVARLARIVCAKTHPTHSEIATAMEALEEFYTIANVTGRIEPQLALAILLYSVKELRAEHVVIDNLTMLLSVDNESSSVVQSFIGNVVRMTAQFGCHTHLVAHIRKLSEKGKVPSRDDARGTGSAADQVDNVIAVWRNEAKEDERAEGQSNLLQFSPDAIFNIDKQRETGERKQVGVEFFPGCGQFVPRDCTPEPMVREFSKR